MIKERWRDLDDTQKYAYVQQSRADRERALYAYKLNQIKENMIKKYPQISEKNKDIINSID